MLHYRFARKLILIVGALITASAIFAVVLTPAASQEIRPLLQSLGIISCTSPNPCQEGSNASTGAGLEGISAKGKGVIGQTSFASTSSSNGQAGVIGSDLSASGAFDSGVRGLSVRGMGVAGQSTRNAGVQGNSTGNNGVFGDSLSAGASGVYGQNDGGGFGVAGRITKPGQAGVLADAGSTGSVALSVSSLNGVGANIVGGFTSSSSIAQFPALSIVDTSSVVGGSVITNDVIDACMTGVANPCDRSHAFFSIDGGGSVTANIVTANQLEGTFNIIGFTNVIGSGGGNISDFTNIDITGQYQKNGACLLGCSAATATSTGRAVVTYAPMVSQPTVEDFGEAQLVNGQTYVHLDPKFANVVDQAATYLVFITPEGEANTLYVTQKSPSGFAVREIHGGRSTILFSYRIVAKPFGSHEARLPMVELPRLFHPGLPAHTGPMHV